MVITIGNFRERVGTRMDELVRELQEATGRFGSEEAKAWKSSLPKLSHAFSAPSFSDLHLYFGSHGNLALEYQLPAAPSWCDVVLLGQHGGRPAAVIIELKDWNTKADQPGLAEGLVTRMGRQDMHPSDQVRGYVHYCRRFHSTIHERNAAVHGCVLLTADFVTAAYTSAPNATLAGEFPLFTLAPDHVNRSFPDFFRSRLTNPDSDFAIAFEKGRYRQDRGFMSQIGQQILHPKQTFFELLDGQRRAFSLCEYEARRCKEALQSGRVNKRVMIVKGPPGSGKSAVAARVWASIVTDEGWPDGNVLMVTTSLSQNSNWSHLFEEASQEVGARGIIRKATAFHPLSTHRVGQLRGEHGDNFLEGVGQWRTHLSTLKGLGIAQREGTRDNENLVSIVDEAHALINPEKPGGVGQFGFATNLGPQAYHIIRSSVLTILFLDPLQGFRERENTSLEDITKWCEELGAGPPEIVSLEGVQFRCAGSPEYVDWVDSLLAGQPATKNRLLASAWQHVPVEVELPENVIIFPTQPEELPKVAESAAPYGAPKPRHSGAFEFCLFDDPESMEKALREKIAQGHSSRFLSSDCREWKTASSPTPHDLPPSMHDFHEPYVKQGVSKFWSRPWNQIRKNRTDYTGFVQAAAGTRMQSNPLSEVGCPYTIRGFDYDYVGILWLEDLRWRNGNWEINPRSVFDAGLRNLAIRAQAQVPARTELCRRVAQAYRILFTRALRGIYLWIPDKPTHNHLVQSLAFNATAT